MKDEEYVVEFLIPRQVKVKSANDILAQLDAFSRLGPTERERIEKVRVCDSSGQPISPWETPDMDWLKSQFQDENPR